MTVAEMIRELSKFDDNTEVELFYTTDGNGSIIVSKPLDNYCIVGNRGQVVIMPEESLVSRRAALSDIYDLAMSIAGLAEEISTKVDDITDICVDWYMTTFKKNTTLMIEDIVSETYETLSNLLRDLDMERTYVLDTHNTSMSKVLLERIHSEVNEALSSIRTLELFAKLTEE